jgi:uncharacterized protein YjdB
VLIFSLFVSANFYSCDKTIPVTGVALDQNEATLEVGKTLQLKAEIKPSDATNSNLRWESSDNNVTNVSNKGIVTAKAPGYAKVSVYTEDGNHSDFCHVYVISGGGTVNLAGTTWESNYFEAI